MPDELLNRFTTAAFSVCVERGLVLLLRLGFIHSVAQAALKLAILSSWPQKELIRLHVCAPKPGLSFRVSKVNLSNLWLSPVLYAQHPKLPTVSPKDIFIGSQK